MSDKDASSVEVLDGTPEHDESKELLRKKFRGSFVDEPFNGGLFYVCGKSDEGKMLFEMDLCRHSSEATLKASGQRPLSGEWEGFYSNHRCETCGTQPAEFTFTISSAWETETPLRAVIRTENSSETLEVAEVDPENRELFLNYFGWMFKD